MWGWFTASRTGTGAISLRSRTYASPSRDVYSPTEVEPGSRRGADELTAVVEAQWELLLDGRVGKVTRREILGL